MKKPISSIWISLMALTAILLTLPDASAQNSVSSAGGTVKQRVEAPNNQKSDTTRYGGKFKSQPLPDHGVLMGAPPDMGGVTNLTGGNGNETTTVTGVTCSGGRSWNGSTCVCPAGYTWNGMICKGSTECPTGQTWNGTQCVGTTVTCPTGQTWDGTKCVGTTVTCPTGQTWDGTKCVGTTVTCPTGQTWDGTKCVTTTVTCPTGQTWDGTKCVTTTVTCSTGQTWDGGQCREFCENGATDYPTCMACWGLDLSSCPADPKDIPPEGCVKVINWCGPQGYFG